MFFPPYAGVLLWNDDRVFVARVVRSEACRICTDTASFVVILDHNPTAAEQSEYPLCDEHAGWDALAERRRLA
jgi:hypothetical protein